MSAKRAGRGRSRIAVRMRCRVRARNRAAGPSVVTISTSCAPGWADTSPRRWRRVRSPGGHPPADAVRARTATESAPPGTLAGPSRPGGALPGGLRLRDRTRRQRTPFFVPASLPRLTGQLGFACYFASKDGYEDSILPSGIFTGTPEEAGAGSRVGWRRWQSAEHVGHRASKVCPQLMATALCLLCRRTDVRGHPDRRVRALDGS